MQERSALFFKRENKVLAPIFARCRGQLALIYGADASLSLQALNLPFVFKAHAAQVEGQDVFFAEDKWPLPLDFLDLILLAHPLEQNQALLPLIAEAKKVLCPDGFLLITGWNRRLLKILSALEQQDFSCKVYRFHACRCEWLNRFLEKCVPFLSRGFVIEAHIDTISMTPLQEQNVSLLMARLLQSNAAVAARVMERCEHEA